MIPPRTVLSMLATLAVGASLLVGGAATAQAADRPGAGPGPGLPLNFTSVDSTCVRDLPRGIVRLKGPGDTYLFGAVFGPSRVLRIAQVRGSIGGVALNQDAVKGDLRLVGRQLRGALTLDLSAHPKPMPDWEQTTTLVASPDRCGWAGAITLRATAADASLFLRGSLDARGEYELRGRGGVAFAGTRIPLTGWVRSPGVRGGTTWSISGSGLDGRIDGARVAQPRLTSTHLRPGLHGSAVVSVRGPDMTSRAVLRVEDGATWRASVTGSDKDRFITRAAPGLVATTSRLTGDIGLSGGETLWTLRAPGRVRIGTLDIALDVGFTKPGVQELKAKAASGTILGIDRTRLLVGGPTTVTLTPKGVSGSLTLLAPGELLLDMPRPFRSTTAYILKARERSGWTFDPLITYSARHGDGDIRLTGWVERDGRFDLAASGSLDINGTQTPIRGFYRSAGFNPDGTMRGEPRWSLAALPAKAEGGRVALPSGAGLTGGRIHLRGPGSVDDTDDAGIEPVTSTATQALAPREETSEVTISGTTYVQLAEGDDFTLPVDYVYTDADNWTATAVGTSPDNVYSPYTGLEIPETEFTGTVTMVDGVESWQVDVGMLEWQQFSNGVNFMGSFTISEECTLEAYCPGVPGVYFTGTSQIDFDDTDLPDISAQGAFLADRSWARWDGSSDMEVEFGGISLGAPTVTIYKGPQTDDNPDLVMPDLSGYSANGFGIDFCGEFGIEIPNVTTIVAPGCAGWTEVGTVLAQITDSDDLDPQAYNGVDVNAVNVNGFSWTDLADGAQVVLHGEPIEMDAGREYISAAVNVPGYLMEDFGTGTNADTEITATGWFDLEGNFNLDAAIPVGLKGGGITLEEILVHVGLEDDEFALRFDALAEAVIDGRHMNFDAYVGFAKSTDTSVTVGVTATGTRSMTGEGLMDFVNLLPSGDFEPTNASLIDGTFDGAMPADVAKDGGFEQLTDPGNLIANADFEDDANDNLIPGGDFESPSGSLLPNGDFEDRDLLLNGDFESNAGTISGWRTSGASASAEEGNASSAESDGRYAAHVENTKTGSGEYWGLYQTIPVDFGGGALSANAWITASSGSTKAEMILTGQGCSSPVSATTGVITVKSGTWTEFSVSTEIGVDCQGMRLSVIPRTYGQTIYVDAVTSHIDTPPGPIVAPNVWRPNRLSIFESLASVPLQPGYSSGVSLDTSNSGLSGTLRSDGRQAWMLYDDSSGASGGDFDMSIRVKFPSGSSSSQDTREIANVGFWLNGGYAATKGYFFRLQTSGSEGGFFAYDKGTKTRPEGYKAMEPVERDTWYTLRLTSYDSRVRAFVTTSDDDEVLFTDSIDLEGYSAPQSGLFGQVPDGVSSTPGILFDNFTLESLEKSPAGTGPNEVRLFTGEARSGEGYAALNSASATNARFEYLMQEELSKGKTYTYTAWLRAKTGMVSGTLRLWARGDTDEYVDRPYSVGTEWTRVAVTLPVTKDGHTSIRPSITIAERGAELWVDDQSVEQQEWTVSPTTPGAVNFLVTGDDTFAGSGAATLVDLAGGGASAFYPQDLPPHATKYTLNAQLKSDVAARVSLRLSDATGSWSMPFTLVPGQWTPVSFAQTMGGGSSALKAEFVIDPGQPGVAIDIDDADLSVIGIGTNNDGTLGAPPKLAEWITSDVASNGASTSETSAQAISTKAVTGRGAMKMGAKKDYTRTAVYTAEYAPSDGSVWTGSAWIRTSSPNSKVSIQVSTDKQSGSPQTFTIGSEPMLIHEQLKVTYTGTTRVKLTVKNLDTAGEVTIYVDDVGLTSAGLQPHDPWEVSGGAVSLLGQDDSTLAYSGDGYVELTSPSSATSTGSMSLAEKATVTTARTRELAFWVKSTTGTSVKGSATVLGLDSSGKTLESATVNYTADGTWRQVLVSLQMSSTKTASVRSDIGVAIGGSALIDDVVSRDVPSWVAVGSAKGTTLAVRDGVDDAAGGTAYLRAVMTASQTGTSALITTDVDGKAVTVPAGSTYRLEAYVRSIDGVTRQGTMSLATGAGETASLPFTVDDTWQPLSLELKVTKKATSLTPSFTVTAPGGIDIDSLTLLPDIIVQESPWTAQSGVTAAVYDDPSRAHDSSYGLMRITASQTGTGISHQVDGSIDAGTQVSVNAWVRSGSSTAVSGRVRLKGGGQSWEQPFTSGADWQVVSMPASVGAGGSGFTVEVISDTPGALLEVDDVTVQANPWRASSTGSGTATQTLVYDGADAEEGTNFLRLLNSGSTTGETYLDHPASDDVGGVYSRGTTWVVTAHVRAGSGKSAEVGVSLGDPDGDRQKVIRTVTKDWTTITASYTTTKSLDELRTAIQSRSSGVPIDIDSVTIAQDGATTPDGITVPLDHPESGYVYLWDDAFGIPGAHLWSMTAQVSFVNGMPGLGVGATVYQNPRKAPSIMSGKDWIKGDFAVNVSKADPCFQFDFDATGLDSGISVRDDVFTAKQFQLAFAPRGCEVGPYILPKGAYLSFDGVLGDSELHFDLAVTEGEDGPEFHQEIGITDLNLGGIQYRNLLLQIDVASSASVKLDADMVLPQGNFTGTLDVTAGPNDGLSLDGEMDVTDWKWEGPDFSVQKFHFDVSMDVGADNCGVLDTNTDGTMTMGKDTGLKFDGKLEVDCGRLKVLSLSYEYKHGGVTQTFRISYDSGTHLLAGGVSFAFERSVSWDYILYRYNRHPQFKVSLDFSMDVRQPTSALLEIAGWVKVSDGEGELDCTLSAGEDSCSIYVSIDAGGGHTYRSSW